MEIENRPPPSSVFPPDASLANATILDGAVDAKMGDIKKLGRIGGKTLLYFEVMTTFAIILGLAVGNIAKPGALIDIHSLAHGSISQYTAAAKTAENHGLGDSG